MIRWGQRSVEGIAIEAMNASQFTFYSTGSRFLGTAKKNSDRDFFSLNCPDVITFLNFMEFEKVEPSTNPSYSRDPSISSVWKRGKVDIMLVNEPELREKMQLILKESKLAYLYKDCSLDKKMVDSIVWRAAWQLIKAGKEDAK